MKSPLFSRLAPWVVVSTGLGGAFVAACGDDEVIVLPAEKVDAGKAKPTSTPTMAPTTTTTFPVSDAGPAPNFEAAKLIVVHAATSYGPSNPDGIVRICYATAPKSDATNFQLAPFPPLPHTLEPDLFITPPEPGIPIGAGGLFPSSGSDLEDLNVRPYLISGKALADRGIVGNTGEAAKFRCPTLLREGSSKNGWPSGKPLGDLVLNKDYWQLADIPAGTFQKKKSFLLTVTGCAGDVIIPTFTTGAPCGPDFIANQGPGNGNLKTTFFELDTTTPIASDEIGIQVAHLSAQYKEFQLLPLTPPVLPPFTPMIGNRDDAGISDMRRVVSDGQGVVPLGTLTKLYKFKGIDTKLGFFAAHPQAPIGQSAPFIALSLNNISHTQPTIQLISTGHPNEQPTYFNQGQAHTIILVADPGGEPGTLNQVHFLGFPNVFTPPVLE